MFMNEIKIFENEKFGKIRVAGTSEEPLFCLADVCQVIGIKDTSRCASRLDDDVRQTHPIQDGLGRTQQATFVTESGLYDVIIRSDSEKAKPFRKWITSEVLPSIRKNGGYIANQEQLTPEQIVANAVIVAQRIIASQNQQIAEMSIKMSELEKKSDYLDIILQSKETVTITQIAQDYGMSAKAFNKLLANLGVQHKVNGQWILYAKYLGEGYVHSKTVSIVRSNGMNDTVMNTEWKQKGRIFLYNLLKDNGYLPLIEQ